MSLPLQLKVRNKQHNGSTYPLQWPGSTNLSLQKDM